VLVHGLGETSRCWQRVVPLLEDRFPMVPVDLPRRGRNATIERFAAALEGVVPAGSIVAGHSLGGSVAVALAERAPSLVSRIVLVNAPPTYDSRLTARKGTEKLVRSPVVGRLMWERASADRMRAGLASAFAPGFAVPDEFVEDLRATSWESFVGATTAVDHYLAERDLGTRVAALDLPVTVVFGEQDRRVDPASLSVYDGLDNVTIVRIPEAGHTPIWETPDQVVAGITGP
jgi:pimeloyl-ACP methyl ester carboxylesterase